MRTAHQISWLVALALGACFWLVAPASAAGQLPSRDTVVTEARSDDGLALTVFASAYMNVDLPASVLVGIEVRGLAETVPAPNALSRKLEMTCVAESASSKPVERLVALPIADGATARTAATEGARILTRLTLPPGRYTLRIVARDSGDGRTVAVAHSIEVPTFRDAAITMSGLVVSASRVAGATHTETDDEDHTLLILGRPPTGRRQFSRGEQLEVNAEIYTVPLAFPDDDLDQQLRVTTSLVGPDGRVVWEHSESGGSETLPNGVFGYWHYSLVQIAELAPGPYMLWVTVSDGMTSAAQSMSIAILQ